MDRRAFISRSLVVGGVALTATPAVPGRASAMGGEPQPGPGPYGSIDGREPDALGIVLPEGFTARIVATSGEAVAGTSHVWHTFPDGGATIASPDGDGGWVYVSNSEVNAPDGGAGALRFDADGQVSDAYPIITGTARNCAGGATPWGTWLSGEEVERGQVWEADAFAAGKGSPRPALGRFIHEAVAVDPDRKVLYLSEDAPDGRFYRFTPDTYPSLESGTLAAAKVAGDASVTWVDVPDPSATATPTRKQTDGTVFAGGEGLWYQDGVVLLTTKLDNRVWAYDIDEGTMVTIYDAADLEDPPLTGVDNLLQAPNGDIFVCEDGGSMEVVILTPTGEVAPFLRVTEQDGSELAGAAFSPDHRRMYVSSQRGGPSGGLTYEITGPFEDAAADAPATSTTLAAAGKGDASPTSDGGEDDDPNAALLVGGAVGLAAVAAAGLVAVRRRGQG